MYLDDHSFKNNKKIYEDPNKQTVVIHKDSYYIKHKEFHAVFNQKLKRVTNDWYI